MTRKGLMRGTGLLLVFLFGATGFFGAGGCSCGSSVAPTAEEGLPEPGRSSGGGPFPEGFSPGSGVLKSESFQGAARFSVYEGSLIHGDNFQSSRVVATPIQQP